MRCSVTRPSFRWATRCLIRFHSGGWPPAAGRWNVQRRATRNRNQLLLRRSGGLIDAHAEAETHRRQDFLDLVQALAAEVLGLEHLGFGLLHELADGADVRVL